MRVGDVQQRLAEYRSPNTKLTVELANSSVETKCSSSSTPPAVYPHDRTTASMVDAIGRAVSDGVDLIRLDLTCPEIQRDLALSAAVSKARLRGTVVLCKGGPIPQFVQVVAGGEPITKTMPFRNAGGRPAGVDYWCKVEIYSADLRVHVFPRTLSLDPAGQANNNVSITVFALGGGGRGERWPRWREAHVKWMSRVDRASLDEWLFLISVLKPV